MFSYVHLRNTPRRHSPHGYDLVVICDTLWISSAHPSLIHSLCTLISKTNSEARILVSAGFHTGRPCVGRFFDLCAAGSALGKLVPDEEAGGIWEKNVLTGQERPFVAYADADEDAQARQLIGIEERAKWCVMSALKWLP